MIRHLFPVVALLVGSGLLMFAGGMNGLILPVRGGAEGFSALSLGALGTGWAVGYVAGCLTMALGTLPLAWLCAATWPVFSPPLTAR